VSVGRNVDSEQARGWVRQSLLGGSLLAVAAAELLNLPGSATVLVGENAINLTEFERTRQATQDASGVLLREVLRQLKRDGARTVIVDDDLARRSDVKKWGAATYIGDRILRWDRLDGDLVVVVDVVRHGASGYPLNALVCTRTAEALALGDEREIGPVGIEAIVDATCALIVAVYDAESFLVWTIDRGSTEP
jgi:hypothetical protein